MNASFTRSPEMLKKYIELTAKRKASGITFDLHKETRREAIHKFKHWFIAPNEFPYDNFAELHHLLLPKRKFAWGEMNEDEKNELENLKLSYLSDNYEVILENLPRAQTLPDCFHLHLLILKRSDQKI